MKLGSSLGQFISRYFIFSDMIANGIVPLISVSDVLLSVYRMQQISED